MAGIQSWQIKTMYAISRSLGMDNDELHALVAGLTGEESIRALDTAAANTVIGDLKARQKRAGVAPPAKAGRTGRRYASRPGGVTAEQQGKMWALIGALEKLDTEPSQVDYRKRLCGVVKSATGMDTAPENPFRWLSMEQGIQVIDLLVRIVASEEKKAVREGRAGHG